MSQVPDDTECVSTTVCRSCAAIAATIILDDAVMTLFVCIKHDVAKVLCAAPVS